MIDQLQPSPWCFGEYPSVQPHTRAERSCHDCPFLTECSKVESPIVDPYRDFKNPDGTYNGVAFMAMITGLSEDEIRKTWQAKMMEKMDARKGHRKEGL